MREVYIYSSCKSLSISGGHKCLKFLSWNAGNAFLNLIFKNFPQVRAFDSCKPGMPTRLREKLMKPPDVVLYNLQTSAAQAMINLPLAFSSQELICKFLN